MLVDLDDSPSHEHLEPLIDLATVDLMDVDPPDRIINPVMHPNTESTNIEVSSTPQCQPLFLLEENMQDLDAGTPPNASGNANDVAPEGVPINLFCDDYMDLDEGQVSVSGELCI